MWYRNDTDVSMSNYGCRICSKFKHLVHMLDCDLSVMASEDGTLLKTLPLNRNMIQRHEKSKCHQRILERVKKLRLDNFLKDLEAQITTLAKNPMLANTIPVFNAAFTGAKIHSSGASHEKIVNLMENVGLKIKDHCKSEFAFRNIIISIADTMKKKMIKSMKDDNAPATLIMDTSDDFGKSKQLTILVETMEKGSPIGKSKNFISIKNIYTNIFHFF